MKKLLTLLTLVIMAYAPVRADILFDDFENAREDTDSQTDLGARFNYFNTATDKFYDAGYWYAYADDKDGGTSSATPDYMEDKDFSANGLEQNGYKGQCLHINIQLGDQVDEWGTAFYGVGANLTTDGVYTDFSKCTGFEFMTKGSAENGSGTAITKNQMNFKLLTEVTDNTGTWGDMVAPFTLTSDWTKVTISTADIVPEPYSPDETAGLTWDDVKTGVTKIHFQTNGDNIKAGYKVDFWIDNIMILGMDSTDFAVNVKEVAAKKEVSLGDATPNPFNPSTNISFNVPSTQKVSLKIFDAAGNLIKTLYSGVATGAKTVSWNATSVNGAKVASGVYFYKLSLANGQNITKSMVFVK